jgi:ABC-type transport system involved in multi-copper enzyme maturation permease subunit
MDCITLTMDQEYHVPGNYEFTDSTMKHPVITIAKYTFLEAIKNRLFTLCLVGIVCVFALGQFAGELAITETRQIQGSLVGFIMRLAAVFVISLFVITSVVREFNDKTVDMIISLPLSRYVYYLGKLSGFVVLAVIFAMLLCLPLFLYAEFNQAVLWALSLINELVIIIALCLLCLFTFGNITTAFTAVIAFYLLARSISTIQLLSRSPILESTALSQQFMNKTIDLIAYILPDLSGFTRTEWIVYGTGTAGDLGVIFLQSVIYAALLSGAALFDLYRKNF